LPGFAPERSRPFKNPRTRAKPYKRSCTPYRQKIIIEKRGNSNLNYSFNKKKREGRIGGMEKLGMDFGGIPGEGGEVIWVEFA